MCLDNNDKASTSNVNSDDTNQINTNLISYERLNEATQALISNEEFLRMTSVKVIIESCPPNSEITELSVHNKKKN